MISGTRFLRHTASTLLAGLVCVASLATAQNNNNNWQQQQRQQQQDQQRQQQQQQQRQQQQDQMRQQQQDQIRQQLRQQQQDQMRQQMQQQQRQQQQDQMRQQAQQQAQQQTRQQQQDQVRQQAQQQQRQQQQAQMQQSMRQQQANQTKQQIQEQQRQLQNAQKAQQAGKPAPTGTSQAIANRSADRIQFSNGVAKLTRPLTSAEMKRGFTGKITPDGRALVKFQSRVFAVPAARIGITPRQTDTSQAALATRWTTKQQTAIKGDIQKLAGLPSSGGSGGSKNGISGAFNAAATRTGDVVKVSSPQIKSRIDAANIAKFDITNFESHGIKAASILNGTTGTIAVIGRHMGDDKVAGVRQYAQALRENGLNVEIFDGDTVSKEAKKDFALRTNNGEKTLSSEELMKTRIYQENKDWAQKIKSSGYTIIDIGNPTSKDMIQMHGEKWLEKGFSPFYSTEKKTIYKQDD